MSMHNKPLTTIEETGLIAHGFGRDIGRPSMTADIFRTGVAWGQMTTADQIASIQQQIEHGMPFDDKLRDRFAELMTGLQAQQTESQWISVDKQLPAVAKNDYDYFLVALTVHGTGQRVVFEAAYLNELMLQNNDDNLEEDELPFSGWHVEIERDGDNLYEPITHGTVTDWTHKPLPPAPGGGA